MPDREKILHELDHQVADADWCDNDWKDNVPIWMLRGALALLRERNDCENCAIAIEDRQLVVRCKDCKHWGTNDCTMHNHWGDDEPTPYDWFCADGERR